ncbi:MAG TPA: crotonase/enoyl-CoA hydratase family protein [Rhizomicrobium sp.]|nr:crotonase/enoyl-CoA hydratase family protein [Rhizomicrobium sp.]
MSVHVERKGPVTTVILDRPGTRNAVDRPTAEALANAFLEFERDENAFAAVLWGAGGTFCAGADLKGVAEGRGNLTRAPEVENSDPRATDAPMGPTRMRLSKPVIAAVSGYAVAGGLELALWCDLRVAEEDATFGVFCRRWGVPLIDGGTVRLPRLIGQSRALDMILTGRPVGAAEALQMGLANRVVPRGAARQAAEALALAISKFPQACLRGDRMSAYEQFDVDFPQAMANEFRHGLATLRSGESLRGAARFSAGKGRGGSFDDL